MNNNKHLKIENERWADEGEYIYYNYNVTNNNPTSAPVSFTNTLNKAILDDGRSRYMSTIRLSIDGADNFLFNFVDGGYKVTLSYGGFDATVDVVYVPFEVFPPVAGNQSVFSYQSFIEMINTALSTAFINLQGLVVIPPAIIAGGAPFLHFNTNNKRIQIFLPAVYITHNPLIPLTMFMNNRLYLFFGNYFVQFNGDNRADFKDYQILQRSYHNINRQLHEAIEYDVMDQEWVSLYWWQDITTLVLISNALGVKGEYLPAVNITNSLVSPNTAGIGAPTSNMITDKQMYFAEGEAACSRGQLYYAAEGPWRLACLEKDIIDNIDLTIQIRTRTGAQFQMYLPPYQSLQIKMVFVKKNSVVGGKK